MTGGWRLTTGDGKPANRQSTSRQFSGCVGELLGVAELRQDGVLVVMAIAGDDLAALVELGKGLVGSREPCPAEHNAGGEYVKGRADSTLLLDFEFQVPGFKLR
jgi:hypothetical protein